MPSDTVKLHRLLRNTFGFIGRDNFSPISSRLGRHREQLIPIWNEMGYKVGVEIGVQKGLFSAAILGQIPKVHLHSIDPWVHDVRSQTTQTMHNQYYDRAMRLLQPFVDEGRCTVHKDYSENVYPQFKNGELDFLFIDGAHDFDNCMLDMIHWVPKVRIGGMVAVHDYTPMRGSGVVQAVDAYTRCHTISTWYVIRELLPTAFWIR